MYKNIAKKIKGFAIVAGIAELILGVILWIVFLIEWEDGLAWASLGGGGVNVSFSWVIYGFGQMVGDVEEIKNKMTQPAVKNDDSLPEL